MKYGYKTLNLKIKCTRFENIYTCSTHNNSSDSLVKANHGFKEKKETGETEMRSNFVQTWVSVPTAQPRPQRIYFNAFKNLTPFMTKLVGARNVQLVGRYYRVLLRTTVTYFLHPYYVSLLILVLPGPSHSHSPRPLSTKLLI
jgi:hypothetical protein